MHPRNNTPRVRMAGTIAFLVIYAAFFIVLVKIGPLLQRDSSTYLQKAHIVSPLYPLFLQIHKSIFADGFLTAVIITQLLLGFGACLWFAHAMRRLFSLPHFMRGLLAIILLMPYVIATRFGNSILTEGLAYPLFLVVMKYFLEGMVRRSSSSLIWMLLLSVVLVLTRRQFSVLYPLFAVALFYMFLFAPSAYRKFTLLFVLLFAAALAQFAERAVQYKRDGRFTNIPFTGFHLVTAPLFIAASGDADHFTDERLRALFSETHQRLAAKGLLESSPAPDGSHVRLQLIDRYHGSYNAICWGTLLPVLHENGITDWYEIDKVTRGMLRPLIQHNWRSFLQLYRQNIARGAGGILHAIFLGVFMALACAYHIIKRDGLSLAAALVSMLSIGSLLVIALAEPVRSRYIAYTAGLQICFYIIVAVQCFRSQPGTDSPD
ncbi:MAG: hypothetical protein ABIA59_10680 [Candidatus Latescibacterota bacterium]